MKKLIFLFIFLTSYAGLSAQGGWEKVVETNNNDGRAFAFWEAPSGDVLVAYNVDENSATGLVNNDIFLMWLDQDGQELNQIQLPNTGYISRSGTDLLRTEDGHFIIIASTAFFLDSNPIATALKINAQGEILWEQNIGPDDIRFETNRGFVDTDGHIYIGGNIVPDPITSFSMPFLMRLDESGNFLWMKHPSLNTNSTRINDLVATDNEIYLLGSTNTSGDINLSILKIDFEGNLISEVEHSSGGSGNIIYDPKMAISPDGEIGVYVNHSFLSSVSYNRLLLYKFNDALEYEWEFAIDSITAATGFAIFSGDVAIDELGNFQVVIGHSRFYDMNEFPDFSRRYFAKISPDGMLLSQNIKEYDDHIIFAQEMRRTNDGHYLFCGYYQEGLPGATAQLLSLMVKMDTDGNSLTNLIQGHVFIDENQDCAYQTSEVGLTGWKIIVENNDFIYFGLVDESGNYEIEVNAGTYDVTAVSSSNYWEFCQEMVVADFVDIYDTLVIDFAAKAIVECSDMWVDISTPFLRNCFDNYYEVDYCNLGTISEAEARIEIMLPDGMSLVSAELPFTVLADSTLSFDLGELGVNECGNFRIVVYVDCEEVDLGQTLCTEARIYPDSICIPSAAWSGASIQVTGECIDDNLNFTITNVGDAPMDAPLDYIVVEDQVLMMQDNFDLNAQESINVPVVANGATFRIEAEQVAFHPGRSNPSLAIEGCGGLTPGMVNLFSMDDNDLFIDFDCQEVVASFDPNDKTGFPLGYEEENFIEQNTELEYLIRFQNTGTDTAFTVVIRDTISSLLDISSIRPGSSSHDYDFDLNNQGVLKFTFNNILLPDSTTNLEASNGYVTFKIRQEPNNPIGSVINNSAAIYFDFNAPVITNETIHTIGKVLLVDVIDLTSGQTTVDVNVFPNPFMDYANIEIKNRSFQSGRMDVFNQSGQLVRSDFFQDSVFQIQKGNLINGAYTFVIVLDGKQSLAGKIMVF